MDTHYHLLLETPEPNLSCGMRRLNGSYSQWFNHHYRRHGHLLQGRYKAFVVEKESYLLELCRYIVLNPVRARMVQTAVQWRWSSYRATAGISRLPVWLYTDWVLSQFGSLRKSAQKAYRGFVSEGLVGDSPWQNLRGQLYLGSNDFLRSIGARIEERAMDLEHVPRAMRVPDRPTAKEIAEVVGSSLNVPAEEVFNRKQHKEAYRLVVYLLRRVANMSRREVAAMAGISPPRVSQIQSCFDNP